MDFLDPQKERRNRIFLLAGYGLIAVAIAIASVMLLYQTDGYCVDRKGSVDRCGLVFVSSQPSGATIRIQDKIQQPRTNTKFNLRAGTYMVDVTLDGYHNWRREVNVDGGDVQRFDYPLLIPTTLKTTPLSDTSGVVYLATQSPDKRWLINLVADGQTTVFDLVDLRVAPTPRTSAITVPGGIITDAAGQTDQSWKLVEWSTDNRHVLLRHEFRPAATPENSAPVPSHEYLLLDRQDGSSSRNVTKELSLLPSEELRLFNKRPTLFYAYNTEVKTLRSLALAGDPPVTTQLERVEAYKTDGTDSILYVTDTPPSGKVTPGKVSVVLQRGEQVRVLRQLPTSGKGYLLDMARYDGDWYVVIGAGDEKGVYLYRNPIDQQLDAPSAFPAPLRFLKLANPEYIAFSATAQFILVEQGSQLVVYDIKNSDVYRYTAGVTLDAPMAHFTWMDGDRLMAVSGEKGYFMEYDSLNPRTLSAASAQFGMFFTPDFGRLITMQAQPNGTSRLLLTNLTVE